ncbi:aldehyde dehydrogenase family protein [Sphingomonas bacterium]|uniref:aldehyde dehydrogenase family protein n=1 Tax=Sphingomonas bacterium TaxID=1895847 RepID=UPI0020C6781B|nr:aldehyde dehydrogenase family protein [Sphingomonas bacterium]
MASRSCSALYIDGEWVDTVERETIINPATEAAIGEAPVGGPADVGHAIAAARRAFDTGPWPSMPVERRQAMLSAFLDAIDARADEIVALIVAEAGSTQMMARMLHYGVPMQHARHMVALASRPAVTPLPVETTPNMAGGLTLGAGVMVRDPVGVVAAITAYNFPFFLNLAKIIPALAVGCTVVLKPSPYTPMEALILGEIADTAGLPKGVLNIVTGGKDVGEALTSDPRVDLVSFTGSDAVGAAIQAQAAPTLKRVLLELGGKSAMIVRADADLTEAAANGLGGFTIHAGQGCALLTRHIVHNSVRGDYVSRLKAMAAYIKVGDPADPSVTMGPLIRDVARTRTERYVEVALSEGATLVTGGGRPGGLDKGFFFQPTLFDDVHNSHRIAREEVFGPVGVVIGYDDDDEAIALANDSDFGLSGGIFSTDVGRAYEMALRMRTGGVQINGGGGRMSSHAPFGGVKRSGYGREYGVEGLNEFTTIKTVSFRGG